MKMKLKRFSFLLLLVALAIYDIEAGRFSSGSRSSSRSSSRSHSSSWRSSSSYKSSSHSSGSHSSGSHSSGSHSSVSHSTGSHSTGLHSTSSHTNPGSHGTSSSSVSHPSGTSHTSSNINTNFLHGEGGGATRPASHPTGHAASPSVMHESRQKNPSPFAPSAPPADSIPKQNTGPLQNVPGSFGYPSAPVSFGHPTAPHVPSGSQPSWANPHVNTHPSGSNPPIGFKENVLPNTHANPHYPATPGNPPYPVHHGSTSHPSPQSNPPYPTHSNPPYPTTHGNPPYPMSNGHPSYPLSQGNGNPPYPLPQGNVHPSYSHPSFSPSFQSPSHPSYTPNSFTHPNQVPTGNPYSLHQPVGSAFTPGQTYYPQQSHMLGQPVAQPFIPGQTVIMVPGQQDSGRGLGQMVKEALVFSTINAGVNRLLNPHHHYHEPSSSSGSSGSTSTTTHITYNNHYINTAPGANGEPNNVAGSVPGTPSGSISSSTGGYNPFNPNGMTGGVPAGTGNEQTGGTSVNMRINNPAHGGGTPVITPGVNPSNTVGQTNNNASSNNASNNNAPVAPPLMYRISDEELSKLSEKLFKMSSIKVGDYIRLNLQNRSVSTNGTLNITDIAKEPLFDVQKEVLDHPSIQVTRAMYDNYQYDSRLKENRTLEKRMEENLLIDTFLHTNTMSTAMQWLSDNNFIDPDTFEWKDVLKHLWFSQFDGSTSGFERVFVAEKYGDTDILGVGDWIYFEYLESLKRINYMGYVDKLDLTDGASLLKLNFEMGGIVRPNATIFVGTLPELEMALYTVCFYARPNNLCPVSLGGNKFNIYTHSFRYYGKDLIDLALPLF